MSNFVSFTPGFRQFFYLFIMVLNNCHEYLNEFVFISAHQVRVLCPMHYFDIQFATLGQLSTEI